ncbi:MAG: MotE family protein [Hyphomicrobiales bacterium]|nr:MotE family protein [Hyphomicrobiales bacterium]
MNRKFLAQALAVLAALAAASGARAQAEKPLRKPHIAKALAHKPAKAKTAHRAKGKAAPHVVKTKTVTVPQRADAPVVAPGVQDSAAATLAQNYCGAVAKSAEEARNAAIAAQLRGLEAALAEREQKLAAKIDELRKLSERRAKALAATTEGVIAIYAKMKPDAAAAQIALLEDEMAAAIIARLPPRLSSAILAEMPAAKAATLTNVLATQRAEKRPS